MFKSIIVNVFKNVLKFFLFLTNLVVKFKTFRIMRGVFTEKNNTFIYTKKSILYERFILKWKYTNRGAQHRSFYFLFFFRLLTEWRFKRGVVEQTEAFLKGFNEVLPMYWLQNFDERELEVCLILFILFYIILYLFFSFCTVNKTVIVLAVVLVVATSKW